MKAIRLGGFPDETSLHFFPLTGGPPIAVWINPISAMKNNLQPLSGRLVRMVTFTVLALLSSSQARAGIGNVDANGWTVLTPSADSRQIYVSSSTGSDANNGLTPATPKQTIAAADTLIRDGYPDWILLKRGDTFPQPSLARWKSGRSAAEPLVLTYYGDSGARPVIKLTNTLIDWNGRNRSHQAFVGLDLYRAISDPDSPEFTNASGGLAFRFVPDVVDEPQNVLVEDCRLRFCWINCEGREGVPFVIRNANFRRNIIAYNWTHGSSISSEYRIQGIYVSGTAGIVIEENVLHHNGWSEAPAITDAEAGTYSHNVYMSIQNDGPILVRGNVFSRAAGHGLQLRSGGTAEMNAFINNSIGMNMGYSAYPARYTGNTYVRDNVVTDGKPMIPNDSTQPQTSAIWGIWKQLINNVTVNDNIVANILDNRAGNPRPYMDMTANQFGTGNIAWSWVQGNDPTFNPGWLQPTRNAASFAASLGFVDYNAWVTAAINRPLRTMPFDLTAYSYVNYIRAGFNKSAVTPPYVYDSGGGVVSTESFLKLNASTTDQFSTGSYAGDNGETWSYVNTLRITSGISGTTAQVRRLNGSLETVLPNGVNDLSFTIQTEPGAYPASAVVAVLVDGLSYGTFSPTQSNVPFQVDITNLNKTGPTTIRLNSIGSLQVWVDDIAWGVAAPPPPPPPPSEGGSESFTNLNASTTDQFSTGSYTGDGGGLWYYSNTLRIGSGIDGVSAQLRRLTGSLETTLRDGLDDLTFTIQTEPGQGPGGVAVAVLVNGVSQGTFSPTQANVPFQVNLANLNRTGPTVVRLNSTGGLQVRVDNIIWTSVLAAPPEVALTTTPGGYVLNRRTSQVTQTVTVTNTSSHPVTGPVYLALDSLSGNTTLTNAAGSVAGSPYVVVTTTEIAPNASVNVMLQFASPSSGGVTYTPRIVISL